MLHLLSLSLLKDVQVLSYGEGGDWCLNIKRQECTRFPWYIFIIIIIMVVVVVV